MAGPTPKFSSEQAALIRRLYEAGAGSSVLADQFSTNEHMILRTVKRAGGTVRSMADSARLRPQASGAQLHTPEAERRAVEAKREKYPTPTEAMLSAIEKAASVRRAALGKPCIRHPRCSDVSHHHTCPVERRRRTREYRESRK